MRALRIFLAPAYVFGLAVGLSAASSGCGGDAEKGKMVVPDKPPAEANKDSMDAYKSMYLKGKTGAKK